MTKKIFLALMTIIFSYNSHAQQTKEEILSVTDTKSKELKGIKKVYSEKFQLTFNIKDYAAANASRFGSNEQSGVRAAATLGVTKETLQEITDKAFEMYREKLKENGFEFVDNSTMTSMDVYKDSKPHQSIEYPADFDKEDKICIYSTPNNFTTLKPSGPMKMVKAFKGNDIITSNINFAIKFVDFTTQGGKLKNAKVTTNTKISLDGIPCQSSFFDMSSAYNNASFSAYSKFGYGLIFGFKKPIILDEEIGIYEVVNDGTVNAYAGGYGISSKYRGYIYKVDQDVYKKAILGLINTALNMYIEVLKEKASDSK